MYEDKKGQKKVKVRWFHQNQEFMCHILPPKPHPKEVFMMPYSQVISAECVDDLATVLTPNHYDKCATAVPYVSPAGIHLCFRQYNKIRFKAFGLTICTMSGEEGLENGGTAKHGRYKRIRLAKGHRSSSTGSLSIRLSGHASHVTACRLPYHNMRYGLPVKSPVSVKFVGPRQWLISPYKVDEKIELLCQDWDQKMLVSMQSFTVITKTAQGSIR